MYINNINRYFKYISLLILLILTVFSYHPYFSNITLIEEKSNPLNTYIYLMMIITLFFHAIDGGRIRSKFIINYFALIVAILITGILLYAFSISYDYLSESRNIIMTLLFVIIGYYSKLDDNQLRVLLYIYVVSVIFCISMQIFTNFGGFVISDQYLQYGKNTIGVMTSSAAISLTISAFSSENKLLRFITWILILLLLFITITIRARAAMIITIVFIFFCVYKYNKDLHLTLPNIILRVMSIIVIVALSYIIFPDIFKTGWNYFLNSFFQNHEGDITAGRMDRNLAAIQLLMENPLWGDLGRNTIKEWVHNYFLRIVSAYGIVCAVPIISLYLYLAIFAVKRMIRKQINLNNIGYFVIIIPLAISLEEPTFPFGPGTGVILAFILFGNSLMNTANVYR